MSGWGCPHEYKGNCMHVSGQRCDPGMKGCVLAGRFKFVSEEKNFPQSVLRSMARNRESAKIKKAIEDL
ncbi:MAG: hypothetical protein H3C38_04050 [Rhodospirillales bacterium]|nr:hypothetical protein [Rhodospirillales bacterium]